MGLATGPAMNRLLVRFAAPWCLASSFVLAGCAAGGGGSTGGETLGTSDEASSANDHTAFDFFVAKGLTDVQAAGIVGNLDQESSMSPTVHQYGGGPGRGIAQWSAGGRWDSDYHDNVVWYAGTQGESATSLQLQLQFIWYELETFHNYGLASLRAAGSITSAVVAFQDDFEGCGTCDESNRISYAQAAYNAFAHGGGGGGGGSSGGGGARGCYSATLGENVPNDACVQARSDSQWYECDNGNWTSRWSDPAACNGVHPLEVTGGKGCYSSTLGRDMPDNACVQSKYDSAWYQCANGAWDDRWTDPAACDGVYPL